MTHLQSIFGRKTVVFLTAFLLAVTLGACDFSDESEGGSGNNTSTNTNDGSGDSGNQSQQTLQITDQNAKNVARAALSGTDQDVDTSFPGIGGGGGGQAAARRVNTDGGAAQKQTTDTQICDSGNVDITVNGSGTGRNIDATAVYSSCTIGTTTLDGTVTIDTTIVDKNEPQINDDYKIKQTFTCDLEISDNGVPKDCHDTYSYIIRFDATGDQPGQGQFYFTVVDSTYTFNEVDIAWTSDGTYYTTSDTDGDGIREFSLNGTFSYGDNGSVTVTTKEPFEVAPETGELQRGKIVIKGANGSKLVLSAIKEGEAQGSLRIQLDANGDGDFLDEAKGDFEATFDYQNFVSGDMPA